MAWPKRPRHIPRHIAHRLMALSLVTATNRPLICRSSAIWRRISANRPSISRILFAHISSQDTLSNTPTHPVGQIERCSPLVGSPYLCAFPCQHQQSLQQTIYLWLEKSNRFECAQVCHWKRRVSVSRSVELCKREQTWSS